MTILQRFRKEDFYEIKEVCFRSAGRFLMFNCSLCVFAEGVDSVNSDVGNRTVEQMGDGLSLSIADNDTDSEETRQDYYVYLGTESWSFIKQGNNVISFNPKITNYSDSPNAIWIKYVNSSGSTIGNPVLVAAGSTATYATIPYNAGTYKIYAKAYQTEGSYHFKFS